MGTASKTLSVLFRIGELICAAIVVGILGEFLYYLNVANVGANARLVYTEVIAGISIALSIILMPPFMYSFWAFLLDLIMFMMWIVSFGLLVNLTHSGTCTSSWFYNYWGWYWGRFWRNPVAFTTVRGVGCSEWRAILAFGFIGAWCWLANFCIGLYVVSGRKSNNQQQLPPATATNGTKRHWYSKKNNQTAQVPPDQPQPQSPVPTDV